jgi:hypothetical protein
LPINQSNQIDKEEHNNQSDAEEAEDNKENEQHQDPLLHDSIEIPPLSLQQEPKKQR